MKIENTELYDHDLATTLENRNRLQSNRNLMLWYRELYSQLFDDIPNFSQKKVLEIGSGTSPLKIFQPHVTTTDVLNLEYLDIVFDCHNIADLQDIPDRSIDVITMTNVLHHLRDPIFFLSGASRKLKKGGQLVLVEPFFSAVSFPLLKFFHHEPVNFQISQPVLDTIEGPLSSSNQAMPYMMFFSRHDWLAPLSNQYDLKATKLGYFTSIAYMATGGISRVFPVPHWLYRLYLPLDRRLARTFPRLFASFFSAHLIAK
ncbi:MULTISPECIES: bifunctional 2-polyprenyl-6-hydroxyphenol methylase/3-demethylubiquinol 3-O-methyltransferase UbiG [unclassified Rhizobium]|uniref:class I SAM-dependent methyltransferase n=1 Tax=unclassified Rhizobium TaxID=2613769 RepID=UPI001C83F519|nr:MULTISPECIES: methyltransferase domain-containing protein [unclassified Rhizobium]MBX5217238.1 methyltransferase domain-containing protein [Rhizobium sp. NLR9a]MBX5227644.1 methyltransferase domain-containing protein [Rhizobium sp. NLR9b]MBX5239653.1 methyltransferase domain-containing protein [Rhizobium sp. NLR22b]MBX5245612.1 methyltransferase domain-containing protein [Rhizobium sp. NLR3b]MBX5273528.1 methyltransferase domain-containing protein [Rhizobium sp. NLR13a]